jgi:hypothetical protein
MDRWQNKFEIKSPSFMSAASRKLMSYNIWCLKIGDLISFST